MEIVLGVIIVLAIIGWLLKAGTTARQKTGTDWLPSPPPLREHQPPKPTTRHAAHHWSDDGCFDFEIVGEANYQPALKGLAGSHGPGGARTFCVASIVPEDNNPYDDKAVAVFIQGNTVGYLSRSDARSFRRRLGDKSLLGQTTTCDAVIVGGRTEKGKRRDYGVWLDMKPFN